MRQKDYGGQELFLQHTDSSKKKKSIPIINSSAISAMDSLIDISVSMCWAHMLEALCCNLHTLVPDSSMKFKWWKKDKHADYLCVW